MLVTNLAIGTKKEIIDYLVNQLKIEPPTRIIPLGSAAGKLVGRKFFARSSAEQYVNNSQERELTAIPYIQFEHECTDSRTVDDDGFEIEATQSGVISISKSVYVYIQPTQPDQMLDMIGGVVSSESDID